MRNAKIENEANFFLLDRYMTIDNDDGILFGVCSDYGEKLTRHALISFIKPVFNYAQTFLYTVTY